MCLGKNRGIMTENVTHGLKGRRKKKWVKMTESQPLAGATPDQ
jgi:hypothetical protein